VSDTELRRARPPSASPTPASPPTSATTAITWRWTGSLPK